MIRDGSSERQVEKAIQYLIEKFSLSGTNPKPVVLHSIEVGVELFQSGYDLDTVIAGFLHDLIEDTDTSLDEIKNSFNEKVAELVKVSTLAKEITDPVAQYLNSFEEAKRMGKDALLIRATDLYFNSFYYHLVKDKEKNEFLRNKLKDFIRISEDTLKEERIFILLKEQSADLLKAE